MTVISVTMQPPSVLDVTFSQQQGLRGLPGGPGIQGPPGPPGISSGSTFTFTQVAPSAFWTITHNLNRYPSVEVVDSSGRMVEGDEQYIDGNSLTVSFSAPFAGVAYLN